MNLVLSGVCCWDFLNYRRALINSLIASGHSVTVVAAADGHEQQLRETGVKVHCLSFDRKSLNPIHDVFLALRYFFLFRKLLPDAIFSFGIKPVIYGGWAAAWLAVPFIAVITGLGSAFVRENWLCRLAGRLYRFSLFSAHRVFFLNASDLQYCIDRGIVTKAVASLLPGEGIDMQHFSLQAWPSGPLRFLFVGRLIGDKGVREYIQAARVIRDTHPEISFGLLGKIDPGNPSSISREEVDSWVREGWVTYDGAQEDVRPFISACHVVVLPSYREGLPRALLEAAASGRPVLATDTAGCRDVVIHQHTGWLCPARSMHALVESVLMINSLPMGELEKMGLQGREHVSRQYSDAIVCDFYLGVLKSIPVH